MKIKLLFAASCLLCFAVSRGQNLVLDTDFGINGKTVTSFGTDDSILATLALQPDGKILACGSYYKYDSNLGANPSNINQIAVSRFNADGSLDTTFGIDGKILVPFGANRENENNNIFVLNDGKFLIRANNYVNNFPSPSTENYVLLKYNSNGTPDTSFGTNGVLQFDFDIGEGGSWTMQIQSDNKIVIGGLGTNPFPNNNDEDFAISRYNADGSKDIGFGNAGVVKINFGIPSNNLIRTSDVLGALKIQPDGKILAAGDTSTISQQTQFAILRLNPNGTLDMSFGTNGRVITEISPDNDGAETLQILPDGKFIVAGNRFYNNDDNEQIIVAKYNNNGTLDTSYGSEGKVFVDDGSSLQNDVAFNSRLMPDGKLLLIGASDVIDSDSLVLRLNADGSQDATFGANGFLSFDAGPNGYSSDLLLQPDGKIVLGGSSGYDTGSNQFTLWRLENSNLDSKKFMKSSFSVAPNPFNETLDVTFNLTQTANLSFELDDLIGRSVTKFSDKISASGKNSIHLNMPENISKGIYFLHISDGKETISIKVTK